jgi:hypothetical protein
MKRRIENKRRRLRGEDVTHENSNELELGNIERMATEHEDVDMENPEADNRSRVQDGVSGHPSNVKIEDDEYDDDSDNLSQASEITRSVDFYQDDDDGDDNDDDDDDDSESMGSYYGLTRADVLWIGRNRVLAINTDIEDTRQAFLSGRGQYDDYVSFIGIAASQS